MRWFWKLNWQANAIADEHNATALLGHTEFFGAQDLRLNLVAKLAKAIQDGMLPRIGRENPLGEIRRDQLVAMVQGIKQTGRNTRLTFYTRRDIRAAEPLDLEFRLR